MWAVISVDANWAFWPNSGDDMWGPSLELSRELPFRVRRVPLFLLVVVVVWALPLFPSLSPMAISCEMPWQCEREIELPFTIQIEMRARENRGSKAEIIGFLLVQRSIGFVVLPLLVLCLHLWVFCFSSPIDLVFLVFQLRPYTINTNTFFVLCLTCSLLSCLDSWIFVWVLHLCF